MALKFGTDGLRGLANAELSPEVVLALGRAAGRVMGPSSFLVGRDTRLSGPLLQAGLAAGLASEGCSVVDLGVLPTPGVAWASAESALPAAMISASHNPFEDNGIKFFAPGGLKISDATEEVLEAELLGLLGGADGSHRQRPTGDGIGTFSSDPGALGRYSDHLVGALEGRQLGGMKVVLDCANGAAGAIAPDVFERLGAEVSVMAHHPNGLNINRDCGSTHPKGLSKAVIETRADLGLAFDGDADRVLAVDSTGQVVDGDHLLALFALDLRDRDGLASDTVVVTVMTNLGFHQAMDRAGIRVAVTGVGDRLVLEAMEEGGYSLGGEQSGHVIFRRLATTGDGVLTGSILADLLVRSGATLDAAAQAVMIRLPQELVNVAVNEPVRLAQAGAVWAAVSAAEAELAGEGRVLLRASGTEPLVRVMVEAATTERARSLARHLAGVVESELS